MHPTPGESLPPCGPTASNGQRDCLAAPALSSGSGRTSCDVCESEYREALIDGFWHGLTTAAYFLAVFSILFGIWYAAWVLA
jgi:hypothetical protein